MHEAIHLVKVPEAGIEPALLAEHEFESCASTSSATQAGVLANGGQNYSLANNIAIVCQLVLKGIK